MIAVLVLLWLLVISMTVLLTMFGCLYQFKRNNEIVLNGLGEKAHESSTGFYSFACGSSDSQSDLGIWMKNVGSFVFVP